MNPTIERVAAIRPGEPIEGASEREPDPEPGHITAAEAALRQRRRARSRSSRRAIG